MSDPSQTPESAEIGVTVVNAAKLLKIKPDELLAFRDYGDYIVGVTVAGQKIKVDKNGKK